MKIEKAAATRKITISLPEELVQFADEQAKRTSTSRSRIIGHVLAEARERELRRLAAEGYQFYAKDNALFAEESANAVSEAWDAVAPAEEWDDVR